jgi:hypothetical protein
MTDLSNESITFGKFKGLHVADVLKDRNYCSWLLKQEWFEVSYEYLYNRVNKYDPKVYFLLEPREGDFLESYQYFNLTPVNDIKLSLTDVEIICYTYYLKMIDKLKEKIITRIENNKDNPYNIKAPVKWLQKFEQECNTTRDEFKIFINSYELPNIPYITEAIKKEGGIEYKGAQSFNIAKKRSVEQEGWWEDILKKQYGENLGTQFKYEKCIFDFLNISTNTIFECKLGLKDFNEEQHSKYVLTMNEYRIIYLIDRDCVIDMQRQIIYTLSPERYEIYLFNIPLRENTSKFDDIIVNYQIETILDFETLFG